MFSFDLDTLLFRILAFVIAFSIHEWAHAMVAYSFGDDTAKREGRLTLNPVSHLDPLGLIMILFGPFGWAKPVPFNPYNLRGNKRLGIILISAAGPISNLILAFIFLKLWIWTGQSAWVVTWPIKWIELTQGVFQFSFIINTAMFVFNLLPIAPLDGSKILRYTMPSRLDSHFERFEPYGMFVLLLIIIIPMFSIILQLPFNWVLETLFNLVT